MRIKDKRKVGEILGRAGLAEKVIKLVDLFIKDKTYINAIKLAGQLSVIADACTFDKYWYEKMSYGRQNEIYNFESILMKETRKDK